MLQEISVIDDGNYNLVIELKEVMKKTKDEFKITRIKSLEVEELLKRIPSIIIINEDRLNTDIIELIKTINDDEDNAMTPIVVISSNSSKSHKLNLLRQKIQYYLRKPFESEYIYLIITNLIDLIELNRRVSPLTGLPGNVQIQREIKKRLLNKRGFAVLYFDLDNFKSYNDMYGFSNGDEIIKYTAKTIQKYTTGDESVPSPFVGHIGGDDFIALVEETDYEQICKKIINDFESKIGSFFTEEDFARGYLEVPNRKGIIEQFPITSISIGVVEIPIDKNLNILEIGDLGAQVKKKAKQIIGSSYYIDSRKLYKR